MADKICSGVDDEIYNYMMSWVASQKFAKQSRRFVANTNLNSRHWFLWRWGDDDDEEDEDDNGEDEKQNRLSYLTGKKAKVLAYTPTFGSHYFMYKGRLCIFRRDRERNQGVGIFIGGEKEEISVACFGRDPKILKDLLLEARAQFMKRDEAKTLIYRGTLRAGSTEPTWQRMMARVSRPFSTVILNEKVKQDLIADVTDYLNPATRRWYANRGIPYRRGYLLHGPPGTGKSSLSLALAGFFKMRIYIVSLNSISSTEENLASLFAELPRRCVVLLEDIDTAGLTHTREEDGSQHGGGGSGDDITPKQGLRGSERASDTNNNAPAFRLSLSGLLNILDGVASQEGRVLIMTTNHLEKLDKALIRPGRVDMIVQFGLADTGMIAAIFRAIFAPLEGDLNDKRPGGASRNEPGSAVDPDEVLKRLAREKAQREETIVRIEKLARDFADRIPPLEFSPAELQGFLMKNKRDPEGAVAGAVAWMAEVRKEKAESERKEEEDERRKKEEREKEEKRSVDKKKSRNSKGRSRKSRRKDEDSSATSVSESSSSASSTSDSESQVDRKRRSRKPRSKSKLAAQKPDTVSKIGDDDAKNAGQVQPASGTTDRPKCYDDGAKGEAESAKGNGVKVRGGDSGYSSD